MNMIDALADIHAKQSKGSDSVGVDARNAKVADMSKLDVVEPFAVKEQMIESATEVACMIPRINDIVASSRSGSAPATPPAE